MREYIGGGVARNLLHSATSFLVVPDQE